MGLYQFSDPTNDPLREPAADILRQSKNTKTADITAGVAARDRIRKSKNTRPLGIASG
jgi:hypothetical protein